MKTSLAPWEAWLCLAAWGAGVGASLYHYYIGQEELLASNAITTDHLPGLTAGWSAVQRPKDDSDAEWAAWKHYVYISWLPLVMHFAVSEVLRNRFISWLPYWYIVFTAVIVSTYFHITHLVILCAQPMLYFFVLLMTQKKYLVWVTSLFLLGLLNYLKKDILFWYLLQHELDMNSVYLILISLSWIQVRCICFSLDYINEHTKGKESLLDKSNNFENKIICNESTKSMTRNECRGHKIECFEMKDPNSNFKHHGISLTKNAKFSFTKLIVGILSYSLYFPTLFMGPLLLHSDFEKSLQNASDQKLTTRMRNFIKDMAIYIAHAYMLELTLHYFYFTAIKDYFQHVKMLRNSGLCGFGLLMGLQFYVKYLVLYGASGALAALHCAPPPPAPRCILRVHRYSHMWRYFDVGLYRFLVRHMYRPALGTGRPSSLRKLGAAALTFTFIFLWHGTTLPILLWSLLNFAGLSMEAIGTAVGKSECYKTFRLNILKTSGAEERFVAAICTPMLMMSFISNIFFFAGIEVGQLFMERFISERWFNILLVCFCLYACCCGSAALVDVPSRSDKRKEKFS